MKQIEDLTKEIKETKLIMVDMAKDIKDMKGFMHVLVNKLGGML